MQTLRTTFEIFDDKLEIGDYFILKYGTRHPQSPIIKISKQELIVIKLKGTTSIYKAKKIWLVQDTLKDKN